jgi:hypothetical protein
VKKPTAKEIYALQADYGGDWVLELWRRYPHLFGDTGKGPEESPDEYRQVQEYWQRREFYRLRMGVSIRRSADRLGRFGSGKGK